MVTKTVANDEELRRFLDDVDYLHDAILCECEYVAGGYVDKNRNMYGENDPGICRLVFQSQNADSPVILIEMMGVRRVVIDIDISLELDGKIAEDGIVLYPAGASNERDFVVMGKSLRYCILGNFLWQDQ